MKSLLLLIFTVSSSVFAQTQQNLTVSQGITLLEYKKASVDAFLKNNNYNLNNQQGNLYLYTKTTSISSYGFTVGYRNAKVNVVSWDEFIGNMHYINRELERLDFRLFSNSINPYNDREISAYQNLKRNLLVSVIVKGNYFTVTVGLKDPAKPYISQRNYSGSGLRSNGFTVESEKQISPNTNAALESKKQLIEVMSKYKSGEYVYSLGTNPIVQVEKSFLLSDDERKITLDAENIKITCVKDSLTEFLSNYFENENIFMIVSKEGHLVKVENDDESKVIDVKMYPKISRWIKLAGKFYLIFKDGKFPITVKYPLLSLQKQTRTNGNYYYFSIDGDSLGFVTDTINVAKDFYRFFGIKEIQNHKPVFLFDKERVKSQVFTIAGVKKTKDLRKVANLGKSAGASLGLGMLKVVSGIPLGSIDSRSVNDNFFRFVELKESEELECKSLSKLVDVNHRKSIELSTVYSLEVYNQYKSNFIKLR